VARISAPPPAMLARIESALLEMDRHAHSALPQAAAFALNALEGALLWLDAANPGSRPLDERVREAVLFVAGNFDRPLSVRMIADAVNLSPSRFAHLFTEEIGTPPARYIELRRLQRAQAMLESSSLSIGAIARTAGFSSQYYFATRFRAVIGVSPSEWRRRVALTASADDGGAGSLGGSGGSGGEQALNVVR
jgi:AraC family transcriptional regulator, arabinose operon regulatory protein